MSTAALAVLAALALSPNDVQIVDVEGEGDHVDIQSAIDAAADGDTIFIVDPREPGHVFDGFTLAGMGEARSI